MGAIAGMGRSYGSPQQIHRLLCAPLTGAVAVLVGFMLEVIQAKSIR